jgi:hypothetical protein
VIALPLSADQPLDVHLGGVRKLTGRLASERGRLMVQIQGRSDPGSNPTIGAV